MKIKCPHCNAVIDLDKKETSEKCKDCAWYEDDGYCGYHDSCASSDDDACSDFESSIDEPTPYSLNVTSERLKGKYDE